MVPIAVLPIWFDVDSRRGCHVLMFELEDCCDLEITAYASPSLGVELPSLEAAVDYAGWCRPEHLKAHRV